MNLGRIFRPLACVLLLAGVAQAGVVTITHTMDYTDNGSYTDGPFFYTPGDIMDHPPHYRGVNEDWGWMHDVSAMIPLNATGIKKATLAIEAWDVDYYDTDEWDGIYMNDVPVQLLRDTGGRNFIWTIMEVPDEVVDELWVDGAMYVYMDIDVLNEGNRVMLRQAELTIEYLTDGETPDPDPTVTVYRFWSDSLSSHFYTASETERTKLIYNYSDVWKDEGVAYRALAEGSEPGALPVYRFWSGSLEGHFYTISDREADKLLTEYADVWSFEGVAFYAFPTDAAPSDTLPVYRFWSDRLGHHFYTMSETEKQKLIDVHAYTWTYEGIAWYAYPASD